MCRNGYVHHQGSVAAYNQFHPYIRGELFSFCPLAMLLRVNGWLLPFSTIKMCLIMICVNYDLLPQDAKFTMT